MSFLEVIFKIGIIIISFSLIKNILTIVAFSILGLKHISPKILYINKSLNYYFKVSLIALFTYQVAQSASNLTSYITICSTAGITLLLHLIGKVETERVKSVFSLNLNGKVLNSILIKREHEHFIIGGSMLLFVASITFPKVFFYPFLESLLRFIQKIYHTPILGWVIGFIGIFFLFNTLLKGLGFLISLLR